MLISLVLGKRMMTLELKNMLDSFQLIKMLVIFFLMYYIKKLICVIVSKKHNLDVKNVKIHLRM